MGNFRVPVRMHKPLTSTFGRRLVRLWGQFVGTYSTPAHAGWAGRQGTGGPPRCGLARRRGRRSSAAQGHVLCPLQRHAAALINAAQSYRLLGGVDRVAGRGRIWQLGACGAAVGHVWRAGTHVLVRLRRDSARPGTPPDRARAFAVPPTRRDRSHRERPTPVGDRRWTPHRRLLSFFPYGLQ